MPSCILLLFYQFSKPDKHHYQQNLLYVFSMVF